MSKHTPEQAIEIHGSFQVIATEHGPVYACPECQHRFPDAKPYAHLTAIQRAAPDMYEALRYYRDECSGAEPSISVFHAKLDAALAKAEEA